MVILLLTSIYILAFEVLNIDLRIYIMLFIVLISAYRASKKLKVSIFNVLDFYPFDITLPRVIEYISSVFYFLYFYIKTDVVLDVSFFITLFTFATLFYYYFFKDLSN